MDTNRSLRLWEILGEEYDHLYEHKFLRAQQEVEQDSLETFELLNTSELLKRVQHWLHSDSFLSEHDQIPLSSDVRFKKLAEWILAKSTDSGFSSNTNLLTSIQNFFVEKLNDPDLAISESWMQEANLRSYTRGLLTQYRDQQSGFILTKYIRRLLWGTDKTEPVSYRLLNRLLLEDVYGGSEYVERNYTGLISEKEKAGPIRTNEIESRDPLDTGNPDEGDQIVVDGYIKRIDDSNLKALFEKIRNETQTALCLSGGGIRSATFALGVVQGLVKQKDAGGNRLLSKFTYLSTVSGGGYLGGWLSAWISHEGPKNTFDKLGSISNVPFQSEAEPIQHLRRYSNYLSPSLGLFSADTWTLIATYLRNLLIIWLVILPFLAALVAIPWIAATIMAAPNTHWTLLLVLFIGGALFMIVSDKFVYTHRPKSISDHAISNGQSTQPLQERDQASFLWYCLLPGALAILLWTIDWYWFPNKNDSIDWSGSYHHLVADGISLALFTDPDNSTSLVILAPIILLVTEWLIYSLLELTGLIPKRYQKRKAGWKELLALVLVGLCAGPLLLLVAHALPAYSTSSLNAALITMLGFPAFLLTMLLLSFLYTGITSSLMEDAEREWSARYSAWFLIVAVVWMAVTGIVLFGPYVANQVIGWVMTTGLASGGLTAFLGKSSKLNGERAKPQSSNDKKPTLGDIIAQATLPIVAFVTLIILLVILSFFDTYLIRLISEHIGQFSSLPDSRLSVQHISRVHPLAPILVSAVLLVIGVGFAWFIDTNRFSLHAMYRARLIRAYLGASRPAGQRRPDPFTGFDENDNIYMGNLRLPSNKLATKPFHIVNIALNLVAGRNLAWQERKATSFTVSPLHAGNLLLGYRNTFIKESQKNHYPDKNENYYGGKRGISLGTAMTISGAAVSPNQGYNSSPLVAFFMTLFNARLGCWLGNPGPAGNSTFHLSSPRLAIRPIINEMIGNTNDTSDYVYLSDGGHFENLGLYEMVVRRNRFILLSDASCDEDCSLEDLGNAIRKIRIDLGIPIDFPLGFTIRSRNVPDPTSATSWAIGRIRYSEVDIPRDDPNVTPDDYDGILLYIKPSFYNTAFNGPRDIFNYASTSKSFPHESTGDQFFSESQFESYRALGMYTMASIRAEIPVKFGNKFTLDDLFTLKGIQACLQELP